MGGRQSKKFDPAGAAEAAKKEGTEERLEKIEDPEAGTKVQNGSPPQPDVPKEGDETKTVQDTEATPAPVVVNGDAETPTAESGAGDASSPAPESATATETPVKDGEKSPESSETKSPESEEKSEKKKKDKSKKKWSFRSLSFSKKDKSKPIPKEDSKSDLSKEQPVAEVSETETATASPTSPTEEPEKTEKTKEESGEQPAVAEKEEPTKVEVKVVSTPEPVAIVKEDVKEEKKEETKVEEKRVEEVRTETVAEKTETVKEISSVEVTEVSKSEVSTSSTTITSVSVTEKVEALAERKPDEIPPPLPASPPPTEAPPPTPVAQTQPEPEEVNGGGEGMAEMPEENGLDAKIDDDEEEPKMNGHCEQSPVKQIVESIIEKVEVMKIVDNSEMTELSETVETSTEVASAEE